tara:strand:- start:408 stop:779 length:372 start_codon:yes stop_codon:yes gene_type:complete
MKIVKPTGDEDFKFIFRPKALLSADITLKTRSKSTNKVFTQTVAWVNDQNYYKIQITEALKTSNKFVNGNYYEITLSDNNVLLTRETFFVTDQTINQEINKKYSANEGLYKPVASDNEYIILD